MKGRQLWYVKDRIKHFFPKLQWEHIFFEEKNHSSRVLVLLRLFFNASTLLKSGADKMIIQLAIMRRFSIFILSDPTGSNKDFSDSMPRVMGVWWWWQVRMPAWSFMGPSSDARMCSLFERPFLSYL
jgi:hypothetical protein